MAVEKPPLRLEHDEVIHAEQSIRDREGRRKALQSDLDCLDQGFRDKGIDTETRIGQGPVAMTSRGRSGLERAFYESVAAGVLEYIERPLLLIRPGNA